MISVICNQAALHFFIFDITTTSKFTSDSTPRFHNLGVNGSQVIGFGRGEPKVVEHHGLVIQREHRILWKNPSLDLKLLAQLKFDQGLGSRQICKLMKKPRSTVIAAIRRLEKEV
jgi:hypothetical protein